MSIENEKGNFAKPMLPAVVGGDVIAWGLNKSINHRKDSKFSPNLWKFLTFKNKHLTRPKRWLFLYWIKR
jgi:hypothetical protein